MHDAVDAGPLAGAIDATDIGAELQEAPHAHVGVQHHTLGQVADLPPQRQRLVRRIVAGDARRSGGRWEEAGEHAHDRRLPRAVRPEQADHFPAFDVEGHVLDGVRRTEVLGEVLDLDHVRRE